MSGVPGPQPRPRSATKWLNLLLHFAYFPGEGSDGAGGEGSEGGKMLTHRGDVWGRGGVFASYMKYFWVPLLQTMRVTLFAHPARHPS